MVALLTLWLLLLLGAAPHRHQADAAPAPPASAPSSSKPGAAHQFCGLPLQLSNFQGHHRCDQRVLVGRPGSIQELSHLVSSFAHVKAVGVGHSWNARQFCAGADSDAINIVMTELSEAKAAPRIDEAAMTVTAPAGLTQRGLLAALDAFRSASAPDGYTLPCFSWFLDQTLAGAVSTATHGSSLLFGSLSSQLRGLRLLLANGTELALSPAASPSHLWKAAAVSVGRLGIVTEVTLAIVKNGRVTRAKDDQTPGQFVAEIQRLSSAFRNASAGGSASPIGRRVWDAISPWDELQWFWFVPSKLLWRASFKRQAPAVADVEAVLATDGPGDDAGRGGGRLPPGAYQQQAVVAAGTGIGIASNPAAWSRLYQTFLSSHVAPGTLPARQAYVSVTETESRLTAGMNSYDQFEVAIPLSKAGACVEALARELYGPADLWEGFRAPMLLRLIRAELPYLSPAQGEPVLYCNLEDHVTYATGKPNTQLQAVMALLRSDVCGYARLHWGKAGWDQPSYGSCFDGAEEYGSSWCAFGCAAAHLDPTGKFAGQAGSSVWRWRAADAASGQPVADLAAACCSGDGAFDAARCTCVKAGPGCRR